MLRTIIEGHLKNAEGALAARIKTLTEQKLTPKACKKDPTVIRFQAVIRKYKGRIGAHDRVAAVIADLETRRAERAARPKVPKEKKKAAPKAKDAKPKKQPKAPKPEA